MFNNLIQYYRDRGYSDRRISEHLMVVPKGSDLALSGIPNFVPKEFDDYRNDENQFTVIDLTLLRGLQDIRDTFRCPVHILSGFRTKETNMRVGGKPSSFHLYGMAADFHLGSGADLREVAEYAKQHIQFGGVGVYLKRGFIHVDVRLYPFDKKVVWEG